MFIILFSSSLNFCSNMLQLIYQLSTLHHIAFFEWFDIHRNSPMHMIGKPLFQPDLSHHQTPPRVSHTVTFLRKPPIHDWASSLDSTPPHPLIPHLKPKTNFSANYPPYIESTSLITTWSPPEGSRYLPLLDPLPSIPWETFCTSPMILQG